MAQGKWYKIGHDDGRNGICDPPWQPGHRDHGNYMDGYRDAQRELEQEAAGDGHDSVQIHENSGDWCD